MIHHNIDSKVEGEIWTYINNTGFYYTEIFPLLQQDMTMVARTMSVMTDKGCDDNV